MVKETAGFSGISSLRAHKRLRTYSNSLPLGSSSGAATGRAPVTYGENLKCLASRQVTGYSCLLVKTPNARQRKEALSPF